MAPKRPETLQAHVAPGRPNSAKNQAVPTRRNVLVNTLPTIRLESARRGHSAKTSHAAAPTTPIR